jgi:hypothetical protein
MFLIVVILDYMLLLHRLDELVMCVFSRCLCCRGTTVPRLMPQSDRGSRLEMRRLHSRVDAWPPDSCGWLVVAVLWRPGRRPIRLGEVIWGWSFGPQVGAWPPFD